MRMEQNEIIIGRQVEKGDYKVEEQYKSVSRRHARLFRTSDGFFIEDLNSTCGTFVNGKPVKIKKITDKDKISLGGLDYCELDVSKILKMIPMTEKEFQDAFLKLRQVYDKYQSDKVKLQSESQGKMMVKRTLPMALPGLLMVVVPFFLDRSDPHASVMIQMFGGMLGAAAMVAGTIWSSKSMSKMPELMNNLREQFLTDYVCPNCGQDFGERPWENIKRQGKCRACSREFNV